MVLLLVQYFQSQLYFFNHIHGNEEFHFGKSDLFELKQLLSLIIIVINVVHQQLPLEVQIGIVAVFIINFIQQVLVQDINRLV
jgi:hypothetical protein